MTSEKGAQIYKYMHTHADIYVIHTFSVKDASNFFIKFGGKKYALSTEKYGTEYQMFIWRWLKEEDGNG